MKDQSRFTVKLHFLVLKQFSMIFLKYAFYFLGFEKYVKINMSTYFAIF